MKNKVINISISLASIFVSFIIGELIVRGMHYRFRFYSIEISKYSRFLQLSSESQVEPLQHRPNSSYELMGTILKYNSYGFRGDEFDISNNHKKNRIWFLGNSITMGWGVKEENIFSKIIESKLNEAKFQGKNFEVINTGIGNSNLNTQFLYFNKYKNIINPDKVILQFFIDDIREIDRSVAANPVIKYSYLLTLLYSKLSTLKNFTFKFNDLNESYSELYKNSRLWTHGLNLLKTINDECIKRNIDFVVMIIPDFHNFSNNGTLETIYSKIENDLNSIGIKSINFQKTLKEKYFGQEKTMWIQSDDPHPNKVGHQAMADAYLERVML